jgi:hypothetical protein
MWGEIGRYEDDPFQLKRFSHLFGNTQVPDVDWIEGAAEDSQPHCLI